jgi:hypothetical protein
MAYWLTGKSSYVEIANTMKREAWEHAWRTDAVEGDTPRAADDDWIEARG